ncbi:MAG: CBS domain-containing protein [Candidatus Roizmanbacteria bacterium]|nr:CBS domain-containing protein [Candidatus Roizmanbacteria bacterium]MCR4312831.1 CBS domain-containing protein [Candidatus Roizmanbacteria bacterium]
MLYFSEIVNKKVYTVDDIYIGYLEDIIFLVAENPIVTKFVIKDKANQKLIISTDYLKKIDKNLIVEKEFLVSYLEENELYLVKNLLDKQIIDLKGNKIVRVNDVALQDKDRLSIAGVDVGILGIFRRLRIGAENFYKIASFFNIRLASQFLSWADIQPLELIRGNVKLRKKEEKLEKIRPEDLADYLEKTNVINARKFLKILDTEKAAEVIGNLNINYQTALFKHFQIGKAAKLVGFLDPDEAVDVLLTLTKKKRDEVMEKLEPQVKGKIVHLLELSKEPIGALLTTEYLTVGPEDTVRHVFEKIKNETKDFSSLYTVYVVNKENQLTGAVSLHEVLKEDLDMPLYKFMIQNLVVIHLTTPVEIAMKKFLKYHLTSLPVINQDKRMEGIVNFDDITNYVLNRIK